MKVDLNADVSEGFGVYPALESPDLYQYLTSANIACGFHAGDAASMTTTVGRCGTLNVQIGAHPGYRDLYGFGRRPLEITLADAVGDLLYQVGALQLIAKSQGQRVQYVKLHGAWYNSAMQGTHCEALIRALKTAAPDLAWLALAASPFSETCKRLGIPVYQEVFADRAYNDDGSLVSRSLPGAVLGDAGAAIDHVKRMVLEGRVKTITGQLIPIQADSICLHGDHPHAVQFAEKLRYALENEGVRFEPFGGHSL